MYPIDRESNLDCLFEGGNLMVKHKNCHQNKNGYQAGDSQEYDDIAGIFNLQDNGGPRVFFGSKTRTIMMPTINIMTA